MKKYLFIIPARAGSIGIRGKNTAILGGRSLISYSIRYALHFTGKENICISTDDQSVIAIAKEMGIEIPFVRPDELASETASANDVIKHAIEYYESIGKQYDAVIYLQPTSPFRKFNHLIDAIEIYESGDFDLVTSVCESHLNPYFTLLEENKEGYLVRLKPMPSGVVRRQDLPKVYHYNGSIYIINITELKKTELHNLPRIKKYEVPAIYALDIDTPMDWNYCEFLLEKKLIDFDQE